MTSVFILYGATDVFNCSTHTEVCGVYADRKKAEKELENANLAQFKEHDYYYIEEHNVE